MIIGKAFSRFFRFFYLPVVRKKCKKRKFTIISQNCVGGVIYHSLGIEFQSPTINLFIRGEDFYKLIKNLDEYFKKTPTILKEKNINIKESYPILLLDDIVLHCMHYKDGKDAIDSWERRKRRANMNNILIICNSWDLLNDEQLILKTINCGYPAICFSTIPIDDPRVILLSSTFKKDNKGVVNPPLTGLVPFGFKTYYETQFDIYRWIDENVSE